MHLNSATFVKGITGTDPILYDGRFQIAFMGRSNVGKSTLINTLTGKQSLCRTSSSPGLTIRMDFFLINHAFYLVDFPGYGFALRSKEQRDDLAKMILWYILYSRVKDRLIVIVIDVKAGITNFDQEILDTLVDQKINFIIVVNKTDHVSISQKDILLNEIRSLYPNCAVISNSVDDKTGREKIKQMMANYIST